MAVNWRAVQAALAERGFAPGPIDGVYGPRTEAALIEFKKSIGFRARPYFGPLTEAALFERAVAPASGEMGWMQEAVRIKGLHEARNVSQLKAWFDKSVAWIDPREIPWCGAFVATAIRRWRPSEDIPDNPLGARNWGSYGVEAAPGYGAVLTFYRGSRSGWQGHVGFYWGEDDAAYHVLGGNQSNAVTVTRIAKTRLLKARMPSGVDAAPKRVILTRTGALSTNEA